MLLAIDIGNTNTVLGLYRGAELVTDWRIRTEQNMTADEYGIMMHNLFAAKNVQFKDVTHMVTSCVVPPMLNTVVEFAHKYRVRIRLAYYPPYHSKYNAIERYWAGLEKSWNGYLLDTVEVVLNRAANFFWKGLRSGFPS